MARRIRQCPSSIRCPISTSRAALRAEPGRFPGGRPGPILRRRSFHFLCFVALVKIGGIALGDFIQLYVSRVGPGGMPDLEGENAGLNLALRGFLLK